MNGRTIQTGNLVFEQMDIHLSIFYYRCLERGCCWDGSTPEKKPTYEDPAPVSVSRCYFPANGYQGYRITNVTRYHQKALLLLQSLANVTERAKKSYIARTSLFWFCIVKQGWAIKILTVPSSAFPSYCVRSMKNRLSLKVHIVQLLKSRLLASCSTLFTWIIARYLLKLLFIDVCIAQVSGCKIWLH